MITVPPLTLPIDVPPAGRLRCATCSSLASPQGSPGKKPPRVRLVKAIMASADFGWPETTDQIGRDHPATQAERVSLLVRRTPITSPEDRSRTGAPLIPSKTGLGQA